MPWSSSAACFAGRFVYLKHQCRDSLSRGADSRMFKTPLKNVHCYVVIQYNWNNFFFCFLGQHLWQMEVPRLGVKSELQLPAYATATATPDPSHVCSLLHNSQQHWIINLLSRGQGSNPLPHGYSLGSLPLSHHRSSIFYFYFYLFIFFGLCVQ